VDKSISIVLASVSHGLLVYLHWIRAVIKIISIVTCQA